MSNLQLRIISAIVMAAAVLALTWIGGLPFRLLSALIAGAVFYEWTRMSRRSPASGFGLLAEALLAVLLLALVFGVPALGLLAGIVLAVIVAAAISAQRGAGQWDASGLAYAALSGFSLAYLRDGDQSGLLAILFLFAVVWTTDIAAYFVGRAVGGPKLAPSISPGKTQSGALGGTVGGVAAGLIVATAAGAGNLMFLTLVALVLSIVSQAGDLFESWVKRRHGRKDSSQIIPGHGGVMDRVDGLVVAAFALYVIGALAASADNPAHGLFAG
ncbi:MAG: phosphatidate cytidylyltransferase [Mesorhizobium sp.]|nr:phosphatidate cytidylyltransferase [Mesorhizobium sp.]